MGKNDRKSEEKMENKTPPQSAASPTSPTPAAPAEAVLELEATPVASQALVPAPHKPTVLERFAKLGIMVPKDGDIDKLVQTILVKRDALTTLIDDADLPEMTRTKVRTLVDLANPVKPGMEEVSTAWSPARILVHQPTSNDPKKPDSSKPGNMYTTSGQLLETPFPFIPLYFNEENVNFEQGQKVPVCSSPDGKVGGQFGICQECTYLPFGKQNGGRGEQKKTDCNSQITVVLLSTDLSQIYTCQFGKTSRSAGAALIALAKAHPFPWKQSYLLSTEKKSGDLGTYWVLKIEPTGKDNAPDVHKVAKVLNELYTAERKRALAEFYLRVSAAPMQAAMLEASATEAGLTAGLGDEEPDLSTPGGSSVRSASKPM